MSTPSRTIDNNKHAMEVISAFSQYFRQYSFFEDVTFNKPDFPIEQEKVACEFLYDGYWWRSYINMGTFQNPRDNHNSWKEIAIELPSIDDYLSSKRPVLDNIQVVSQQILLDSVKKKLERTP